MSKIALFSNSSGTGTFTLASPNSNTDRTLTLPDATGTLIYGTQPSGTIVGTSDTQTLSNKTFSATVGVGGATPSSSGAGITFPATQSASTDVNTLDDYEEGTWTPVLKNAGTGTYSAQVGKYTKIGNLVNAFCYLQLATVGTASGAISITGLPFAVENVSGAYGVSGSIHGGGWGVSRTSLDFLITPNTTQADLYYGSASTGTTSPTHADLSTGSILTVFIYRAST